MSDYVKVDFHVHSIASADSLSRGEDLYQRAKALGLGKLIITDHNTTETAVKLQKKYRSGEIKEEDMTEEQIKSLCDLYDKQIAILKKSNKLRKQRLYEYRKSIQS